MIKIGITGQTGFIGTHLYNTLGLLPENFIRIPFGDDFFSDDRKLKEFVSECDVIVHLAALNRHNDPDTLYETNVRLVKQLISACEYTESKPHIVFSSSTQEERNNHYGRSKKKGRELLEKWAENNSAKFSGVVVPNVFGPFGKPYYNSVVSTFCYQLAHNETPRVEIDAELSLIYIEELIHHILRIIVAKHEENTILKKVDKYLISHTSTIKVSDLLAKLSAIKNNYLAEGVLPNLSHSFDKNLFSTFLTYIDHQSFFPFQLKLKTDERGSFVETLKLNSGGQVSFSTTVPGITRGNHFHTRKAERFVVIKGRARIELRRIGSSEKITFELDGATPSFVDMPIWYSHNITNIGKEDLYTLFWISEIFDSRDPDTFFEEV